MQIIETLQIVFIFRYCSTCFGNDLCFNEGNWTAKDYIASGDDWFTMKGRSQLCMVVNKASKYTFAEATKICSENFANGTLMKNESFGAFNDSIQKYKTFGNQAMALYVDFEPRPANECFQIDYYQKVAALYVDKCDLPFGFICEYPRQNVCTWEMMTDENATQMNKKWILKTRIIKLHEIDGSEKSCKPAESSVEITNDLAAKCTYPLFKNDWSQWSDCGVCGTTDLWASQSRHQEVVDRCKQLAPQWLQRNHIRFCAVVPKDCPSERLPIAWIVIGAFCVVLLILAIVDLVVGIRVWKLWKLHKYRADDGAPKTQSHEGSRSEKNASKSMKMSMEKTSQRPSKKTAKSKSSKKLSKLSRS